MKNIEGRAWHDFMLAMAKDFVKDAKNKDDCYGQKTAVDVIRILLGTKDIANSDLADVYYSMGKKLRRNGFNVD